MMKVLHAGIFQDHCLGGDIVFRKGLLANGLEHESFDFRQILAEHGQAEMNRRLVQRAASRDLLFIGKGESISPQALRDVRRSGCKVTIWYGDARLEPEPWLVDNLRECDVLFMSSAGDTLRHYFEVGRPKCAACYLNPCDPHLVEEFTDVPVSVDRPLFSGTYYGFMGPEREEVMRYLSRRWDIQVIGTTRYLGNNSFLRHLSNRFFPVRYLRGKNYIEKIIRCKFGIGVSAFQNIKYYTSDRLTHYLLFGKLYLAYYFPGCETLFDIGKELDCYHGVQELKQKIRFYLRNPEQAEAMGRRGQEKMCRDYNATCMVRMMLDVINTGTSSVYPWVEVHS
jgi:hypothetical protein